MKVCGCNFEALFPKMSFVTLWWIFAKLIYSSRASIFESTPTLNILHKSTCSEDHLNLRWTFADSRIWRTNVLPQIFEFHVLRPYPFRKIDGIYLVHHEDDIYSVHIFLDENDWNQIFEFRIGFEYNSQCQYTVIYSTSMQSMLSNCMTSKNDNLPSDWMYQAPLYAAIGVGAAVGTAATAAAALPML